MKHTFFICDRCGREVAHHSPGWWVVLIVDDTATTDKQFCADCAKDIQAVMQGEKVTA